MGWSKGRGLLGPLKPLIGEWVTSHGAGDGPAAAMRCTRSFAPFGKDWIMLDACWQIGPARAYREIALFGKDDDGALGCFSFTNDGKRSLGRLSDGSDVDPAAIAFEAQMPAGLARMIYWPCERGAPGFRFAVESRTAKGWNRFLSQHFVPA
jgi:hypothetical protein